MVRGIRIVGDRVTDCDVTLDGDCVPCPVAEALEIPLVVKRERGPGEECFIQLASRFMSNPYSVLHLAPMDWQYGGALGPAPPVVAARTDGIPFTKAGWAELDKFICNELGEGPFGSLRRPFSFRDLPDLSRFLGVRFPEGVFVMPLGFTCLVELNGILGAVTGRYENGRVGVSFPEPHGVKAVRPENLFLEDGTPADRGEGGEGGVSDTDGDMGIYDWGHGH